MTTLRKDISLFGLSMIAIGSCIGSGIFLTPAQIAADLPSPPLILGVWILGGIITLTGALTFAELGALFPMAGGVYVYLKEAYGDVVGFLYGWAYLWVIASGAIAALSMAFARYFAFIVPMNSSEIRIVAIAAIVVVTVINLVRVKAAEVFANAFTMLKLLGIAAVICIGFLFKNPEAGLGTQAFATYPDSLFGAMALALIGVLWSYGGWQHATYVSSEVKDPQRTVPRAIIFGSLVVSLVYVLTNLSYLLMLPVSQLAASQRVAADAIARIIPVGGTLVAIAIMVSTFGTAGIYTLSAPRIYYAMAKDGLFFKSAARVHPLFRTPVNAILFQSVWAVILLLFWGTFEDVITYVVFTDWIFFCLTAIAVFVFRLRLRHERRAYRTFGYPVTPIVFILITFWFVVNTMLKRPAHAWAGFIFLLIGGIFFIFFKAAQKNR